MSKRAANSPPEAEKSKDWMEKPSPITPPAPTFLSSFAQRLNAAEGTEMAREKRWHKPMTDREKQEKWEQVHSRRRKQHSTGRSRTSRHPRLPLEVLLENGKKKPTNKPRVPTLSLTTSTQSQSSTLAMRELSVMRSRLKSKPSTTSPSKGTSQEERPNT